MVRKGEFLERSVAVDSGGVALDALYHRGPVSPPCLLAAPHPALGGSMHAPVIAELAWALTREGHATMRFDWRGVGASQGTSSHPAGEMPALSKASLAVEIADLLAAGDQLLATTGQGSFCAVGYSFGAAVALAAADDARIERLILIAPPTGVFDFSATAGLEKPLLVVAAHHDALTDRAVLRLPPGGKLEVVPHADHSFVRGLTELGKIAARWLRGDRPEWIAPADGDGAAPELELDPGDGPSLELDLPERE